MWLLSLASHTPTAPRRPPLPATLPLLPYLFFLSASRLSYSFSAGKVKCCLLPVRSKGAQGYSPTHPLAPSHLHLALWQQCFSLRAPLHCHRPAAAAVAVAAAAAGSSSRPGCRGMCLSPVVSSLLLCSQLLQVDLFSTRHTERGPHVPAGQQQGSIPSVYGHEK